MSDTTHTCSLEAEGSNSFWRRATCLIILMSAVIHGMLIVRANPLQSANDRSRWCTVWSLVNRGTYQIDEIRQYRGWDTIDLIYDGEHFYSTKPPILATGVAGIVWSIQRITGWTLSQNTQPVSALTLLIVNLLPFVAALYVLAGMLSRLKGSPQVVFCLMAAFGFATLCTPFLVTLNNHTVGICALMFSLAALARVLQEQESPGWVYALCGFFAAWTVCNELPAGLYGLASFVLCLRQSARRTWVWYVPAAIVPLALFFGTNWLATGGLKPAYAAYGTEKYLFAIDGVPSYWSNPQGVDRNLDPPWLYIVHCLVGHHGIFSLTPLWVLSAIGWWQATRGSWTVQRTLSALGGITTLVVLIFYWTRTENYNYGGVSCGLRWAIWLIPFWLIAALPVVQQCLTNSLGRWIFAACFGASLTSAWWPIDNPWQQPWQFVALERNGWINYRQTHPLLPHDVWSWFPTIPKVTEGKDVFVEWSNQTVSGVRRRVFQIRRTVELAGEIYQVLEFREYRPGEAEPFETTEWAIHAERWNAGRPPAECFRWLNPRVTQTRQLADLDFVRGIPLLKKYHPGPERHLVTPLKTEALPCQRVAVQLEHDPGDGRKRYRVDAWFTPEVPFGVAQYDLQITSPKEGAILSTERWVVTRIQRESLIAGSR